MIEKFRDLNRERKGIAPADVDAETRAAYSAHLAEIARKRRARLKAEFVCINGRSHGMPSLGYTKCARCREVHRRSR